MTCREFERLLDQKAPDAETRAAMQRHAENCPECRLLLELRGLDAQEQVPEEAATRWRAAIRTEQARRETKGKGFIHSRAFAPVCAAAAVLVAVVALSGRVEQLHGHESAAGSRPEAKETVMESAAPEVMPRATSMPTLLPTQMAANATVRPAKQKVSVSLPVAYEEAAPMLETMSEEAAVYDEAWEADTAFEIADEEPVTAAGAMDAAAFTDDMITLRWTADRPLETARSLMAAVGMGETAPEGTAAQARIVCPVRRSDWPAFRQALMEAGCADIPEEENLPWSEEETVTLTLIIIGPPMNS